MLNPFTYGNPVSPDQLIDRRSELRRVMSRVLSQGQSTAIVGAPRTGKTSLLLYLKSAERESIWSDGGANHLFFSFIDAQALPPTFTHASFWSFVLQPFHEHELVSRPDSQLGQAYQACRANDFAPYVLERFLSRVRTEGFRLVLLLDEFDVLLSHPLLASQEFLGSLRSLISRSMGALALVIASRRPLQDLARSTEKLSGAGSPLLNFLSEVVIGPLPDADVELLLLRAEDRFTVDDRRFIRDVAGGHPYLLQAAAAALWETLEDGVEPADLRRQVAAQLLYSETQQTLGDTWRLWSSEMRLAFVSIALIQIPQLLDQSGSGEDSDLPHLEYFVPELRALSGQGFVSEDESATGGWRVRPLLFLWWLADELSQATRGDTPFKEWLRTERLTTAMKYNTDLLSGWIDRISERGPAI